VLGPFPPFVELFSVCHPYDTRDNDDRVKNEGRGNLLDQIPSLFERRLWIGYGEKVFVFVEVALQRGIGGCRQCPCVQLRADIIQSRADPQVAKGRSVQGKLRRSEL
jgi:hypothetical protein